MQRRINRYHLSQALENYFHSLSDVSVLLQHRLTSKTSMVKQHHYKNLAGLLSKQGIASLNVKYGIPSIEMFSAEV